VLPVGDSQAQIAKVENVALESGTWEFDFEFDAPPTGGSTWEILRQGPDEKWMITLWSGGQAMLRKRQSGTTTRVIEGTWPADGVAHSMTVERDGAGNWEFYFDGASQGTATDSYMPASQRMRITNQADVALTVQEIRFY